MTTADDARFWNRMARRYARTVLADPAGYDRTLTRTRAYLKPADRVLELGCGTGSTALRLAADVDAYRATDLSPEMIAIALEKLSADPVPGLTFEVATAEAPDLQAGGYAAVLGFSYLHLVRDVPATLSRIAGLLGEDGVFISKTPCLGDMSPLIRGFVLPMLRAIGKAPHVSAFSQEALRAMIVSTGFDILAAENHASRANDRRAFIVARKIRG